MACGRSGCSALRHAVLQLPAVLTHPRTLCTLRHRVPATYAMHLQEWAIAKPALLTGERLQPGQKPPTAGDAPLGEDQPSTTPAASDAKPAQA